VGITYQSESTDHFPPRKAVDLLRARPLPLLAALSLLAGDAPLPAIFRPLTPKPERKCALPGCAKIGTKAYCCAEHCREHQRLDRERRTT